MEYSKSNLIARLAERMQPGYTASVRDGTDTLVLSRTAYQPDIVNVANVCVAEQGKAVITVVTAHRNPIVITVITCTDTITEHTT
jgi:hypothetical protein